MSNTSKGWGRAGSKFWMQMVACFPTLEDQLIGEIEKAEYGRVTNSIELDWISPNPSKNLEEYSLNSEYIKKELHIPSDFWHTWKTTNEEFWPSAQPQWDGIAYCKSNQTLYLIEAKAHISETHTDINVNYKSKGSIDSFLLRRNSLRHARMDFATKHPTTIGREEKWWGGPCATKLFKREHFYYQMGNRLTFLKFMNEKKESLTNPNIKNVKLIFLNFADDYTLGKNKNGTPVSEPIGEWESHYEEIWKEMTGSTTEPDNVLVVTFSVNDMLPNILFRKDVNFVEKKKEEPNGTVSSDEEKRKKPKTFIVDVKKDNLFFYKIGSAQDNSEINIKFKFHVIDGKMRCCKRGTNIPIKEIETILGVN